MVHFIYLLTTPPPTSKATTAATNSNTCIFLYPSFRPSTKAFFTLQSTNFTNHSSLKVSDLEESHTNKKRERERERNRLTHKYSQNNVQYI